MDGLTFFFFLFPPISWQFWTLFLLIIQFASGWSSKHANHWTSSNDVPGVFFASVPVSLFLSVSKTSSNFCKEHSCSLVLELLLNVPHMVGWSMGSGHANVQVSIKWWGWDHVVNKKSLTFFIQKYRCSFSYSWKARPNHQLNFTVECE